MQTISKLKFIYAASSLYFYHPIITLFYLSRGLTLFQIVGLEAALCAAIVAFEVPTGLIADRIGRKICLCLLLICNAVVGIATLYATSYPEFLLIQVARAHGTGTLNE